MMLKRSLDELQNSSNETADTCLTTNNEIAPTEEQYSDISEPATKIIRIEDGKHDQSNYSDKCIQVDSEEYNLSAHSSAEHLANNSPCEYEDNKSSLDGSSSSDENKDNSSNVDSADLDLENNDEEFAIVHQVDGISYSQSCSKQVECPNVSEFINEPKIEFALDDTSISNSSDLSSNTILDDNVSPSISTSTSVLEPKGPLRGVLNVSGRKAKIKKSVVFNGVTVYYFRRSQGFTCVPSQGGSTLGMENNHSYYCNFTLETHAEERKRAHRDILFRQRRFSKINKQSSTSDSEEDSYDDLSDISDIDLENDNCYFLQPVPIKQRRALLRSSGVRKIEASEKEDCRNIRISREYCGCSCRVYCNPEVCTCAQAGIKCQVDRMSFPCGCTHENCQNSNGRVEFNPIRVRTHFIHTIMKLELEKKQDQEQKMPSMLASNDAYSAGTSNYNQCSQSISASNLYMPLQGTNQYVTDSSNMLMQPNNDSYVDQNCSNIYNNDYSSDNSSYSENSDYTSDDFEDEYGQNKSNTLHQRHSQPNVYSQQTPNYPLNQDMIHMDLFNSTPPLNSIASTSSNMLPPFPSINSNCDLSASGYKDSECHSYQEPNLSIQPYISYSSLESNIESPAPSIYSYDIHSSSHYDYTTEFEKDPNYSQIDSTNTLPTYSSNQNCFDQQRYIDLSLSIASSSSAESLLSAANNSDEDSRLTPVTFNTRVQPIPPSDNIYPVNDISESYQSTFQDIIKNNSNDSDKSQTLTTGESNHTLNDNQDENFGEIIKKSIVESVSA